jgi:hypothetical protein
MAMTRSKPSGYEHDLAADMRPRQILIGLAYIGWTTRSPTARYGLHPGTPRPLALFRAARVDYSLHRLFHYTGTDPEHFQNFVIFTNYQFYVDAFGRLGRDLMALGHAGVDAFVEPGNVVTSNARLGGGTSGVVPGRMRRCRLFISSSPAIEAPL